jgi:deoxyribodipyrimidine photolyase-related protein
MRHLVIVLGDQLDGDSSAFDGFDPAQDAVWMAEAAEESTHVWSSQPRSALFLAAMRAFADTLRQRGWPLRYQHLDDTDAAPGLDAALARDIAARRPQSLVMTAPGDWRVLQALRAVAQAAGLGLDVRDDRHFFSTVRDFAAHAKGRKQLRLETFYRQLRQSEGVLLDEAGEPEGGQWNYDAENREAFGPQGPGLVPPAPRFAPDARTRRVLQLVGERMGDHPGQLADFAWPVNREQALQALDDFIEHRLPQFGLWQDAMWPDQPFLWHSLLASSLNLKLLKPHEVVARAEAAYRAGTVPLAAAEGFIRQILGWREYVRGVYWTQMPNYIERNTLQAEADLPAWYWTAQTHMVCLRDALQQTLRHGYAHHIQRLMVAGLYALLLGVRPKAVHAWYLAVYVDAVEWVELPNTLGMSQFADGTLPDGQPAPHGAMASKPYIASGQYIQRMSGGSYCKACRFKPTQRTGPDACPFTTLYWDFLLRHEARFAKHPRLALQVKNLARLEAPERRTIRIQAAHWQAGADGSSAPPANP